MYFKSDLADYACEEYLEARSSNDDLALFNKVRSTLTSPAIS